VAPIIDFTPLEVAGSHKITAEEKMRSITTTTIKNTWQCPIQRRSPFVLWTLLSLYCLSLPYEASSSTPFLDQVSPDVRALIQELAPLFAASNTNNKNDGDDGKQHLRQADPADLWRRLGKTQLDAREYAEARRIFCHGSMLCPWDEKLCHHVQVWNAFHDNNEEEDARQGDKIPQQNLLLSEEVPPPLEIIDLQSAKDQELFLTLDVPTEAIPEAIQQFSSSDVPPLQRVRLIHASKEPLFSKQACHYLIQAAQLAATQRGGWTTDRHIQAPKCDIPIFELAPPAKQWCRQAMQTSLLPLLAQTVAPELKIQPDELHIQDCFIVRYDADTNNSREDDDSTTNPGFASLKPHEDESLLSLTIALNDMNEYEGGGLYIQATGDLLNGDAGTVLCFAGQLVHGGYPVTRGTRWILTVFLYVDNNQSGKPNGYTLKALEELIQKENSSR